MTTALGSSGSGYTVVTSELRDHANVLSQLAGQMGQASSTAQSSVLGSNAFGEIAVALGFVNLIKSVASPGVNSLQQAQQALNLLNTTIKTTAQNYDSVEQNNMSRFMPSTSGSLTGSSSSTSLLSGTNSLFGSTTTKPTTSNNNHGANILNDVNSLEKDISSGNWIQAGLAGMKVVQDIGSIMSDPIGAVVSFGFNFLVNAVKPLHDAIGWLVGNPSQVAGYGNSWQGVAKSVLQIGNTLNQSLNKSTVNWTGAAADSYKATANDKINTLGAVSSATNAIGQATQVVGQLVQKVQQIIKNLVSQAMGQIIQTASAASFMITIPVVVAEVVREVISWMQKIASVIQMLSSTFGKLLPLLTQLAQLFGTTSKSLSSGVQPLSAISPAPVQGITLPTPVARVAPITT